MVMTRGTHCGKCAGTYESGQLDPDDFKADLEDLGWSVPNEDDEGEYICPACKPKMTAKEMKMWLLVNRN